MFKKYIKLFGGLTPPTPFVTSIEADFACNAYCKHTCKVHVRPSRELVRFKKCFSAFSSNTPGRHCWKKKTKKYCFETYKLTTWSVHVLCFHRCCPSMGSLYMWYYPLIHSLMEINGIPLLAAIADDVKDWKRACAMHNFKPMYDVTSVSSFARTISYPAPCPG